MTKNEILIKRDMLASFKKKCDKLELELMNVRKCEECQEESDDCNSVLWYADTEDACMLITCTDCQKKYAKHISAIIN